MVYCQCHTFPSRKERFCNGYKAGQAAALTPENLAALGYVTWLPASEKPGKPGAYPVLGPDNFKTLDRWDGQEWVSGITVYWLPLPPLPGKEEE